MRNVVKFLFLVSTVWMLHVDTSYGQTLNADSARMDSLFNAINRRPSEAELKWVVDQISESPPLINWMDLIPWITALTAFIGFFLQRKWQLKKDRLERLYSSLQWFEGSTQKRSLGIAMIEANWPIEKSFHKTWISVLTNQAVYLLVQSGQDASAHEIENLKRIMKLLTLFKEQCTKDQLRQLARAIEDSLGRGGKPKQISKIEKDTIGLNLSEGNLKKLEDWKGIFVVN